MEMCRACANWQRGMGSTAFEYVGNCRCSGMFHVKQQVEQRSAGMFHVKHRLRSYAWACPIPVIIQEKGTAPETEREASFRTKRGERTRLAMFHVKHRRLRVALTRLSFL